MYMIRVKNFDLLKGHLCFQGHQILLFEKNHALPTDAATATSVQR